MAVAQDLARKQPGQGRLRPVARSPEANGQLHKLPEALQADVPEGDQPDPDLLARIGRQERLGGTDGFAGPVIGHSESLWVTPVVRDEALHHGGMNRFPRLQMKRFPFLYNKILYAFL